MSNYPIITIQGDVLSKKNKPNLHCLSTGMPPNDKSKRHCQGTMRPMISDDISKSDKEFIAVHMRRSWAVATVKTPVNVAFRFFVPKFPELPNLAGRDLSNSYQLYEDLMQADIWKVHKKGRYKGDRCLYSAGAGIIENDGLIMGHVGSKFIFLCMICPWGITGTRSSRIRKGIKTGCPGPTKCPDRKVEIEISDMVLNRRGFYD